MRVIECKPHKQVECKSSKQAKDKWPIYNIAKLPAARPASGDCDSESDESGSYQTVSATTFHAHIYLDLGHLEMEECYF